MAVSRPTNHRCSVLVVEDDAELREVLRVALTTDGYDVWAVVDGRDALRHLRSTADTCIILLDLSLPVMDGRQFRTAQLRDRSLAWVPVVVLSGGIDAARDARELGARSFVRKPLDVDELRRALRHVGCVSARQRVDKRMPHAGHGA
ncbi:MAG: response regulator [Luteitalea sp.]|nr:response regulator [Luteitalea sp.]